jgi:hypothetical protein
MVYTPQAWPSTYSEQQAFIRQLELALETLEQMAHPATLIKSTQPSSAELLTAWQNRFGQRSFPVNGQVQWYNPSKDRIENIYTLISEADAPSSDFLMGMSPKDYAGGFDFLGQDYAETSGISSLSVTGIPNTYTDLCILVHLRSTVAAATSNQNLRINGGTSGYYLGNHVTANDTGHTGSEALNAGGVVVSVPGTSSDVSLYLHGLMWIHDYSRSRTPHGWINYSQMNGAASSPTRQNVFASWLYNVAAAVNAISVVPATANSIEQGSYLTVFGVK